MFVLLKSTGEYSDTCVEAMAVSVDKNKLEARIGQLTDQQLMHETLYEQLQKHIADIELSYLNLKIIEKEMPIKPKCNIEPHTAEDHARCASVKRKYESELLKWQNKRYLRQEKIRDLAILRLKQNNPNLCDADINDLNWNRYGRENKICYDIVEVESL